MQDFPLLESNFYTMHIVESSLDEQCAALLCGGLGVQLPLVP